MATSTAKQTQDKTPEKTAKTIAKRRAIDPNEIVTVFLHLDKQHMEPLHVSINDYSEKIPRGVEYPVPYYVAMHIKEMQSQDMNTALVISGLVDEFERKASSFGIEI